MLLLFVGVVFHVLFMVPWGPKTTRTVVVYYLLSFSLVLTDVLESRGIVIMSMRSQGSFPSCSLAQCSAY